MKFTRELAGTLTIRSVGREAIVVGGEAYPHAVMLTPDDGVSAWEGGPVAELDESHFEPLLPGSPELIVLGTGGAGLFPPRELVFAFARRGIGLETMDTSAAARTYNVLVTEGRRVAAVLYLPD